VSCALSEVPIPAEIESGSHAKDHLCDNGMSATTPHWLVLVAKRGNGNVRVQPMTGNILPMTL
jgi:hypothetical protein